MSDIRDPDFYLAHESYVRALARRLVYDPHGADDLFQAAWLAALQRPARDVTSPRRWLGRIVRNLATKSWLRARRRQQREQQREAPPLPSSPEVVLAHEHERRRVVDALLGLDEPYRATLIARFFDGLAVEAIAARDGVPIETVRTRQKRGLQRLRERLLPGGGSTMALVFGLRLGEPSARAWLGRFGHGVMLMHTKKLLVSVGILLLATIGWLASPVPAPTTNEATAASAAAVVAAGSVPTPRPAAAPPTVAPDAQRVAVPTATATEAPSGALALRVTWADGRAAVGIGVRVGQASASNYEANVRSARTDADGRARFERLAVGEVFAECDRGVQQQCVIHAGRCTDATMVIEPGVQIHGRVLDVDGRPAPGAVVYMLHRYEPYAGHVVAQADAEGVFGIEHAPAERALSLSARMAGRAPSTQQVVMAGAGATIDVELRFEARGGVVVGGVTDGLGAPIEGAVVLVGPEIGIPIERLRQLGGKGPPLPNQRTSSDAHGSWCVDGVAAGETPVLVMLPGLAPWTDTVFVVEGATVRCDAVLSPGARLAGKVHDERGAVVAAATVHAARTGMQSWVVSTDGNGDYAFEGLPIGLFPVMATKEGAGNARAEFLGSSGAQLLWDPVLTRATTLHGRVLAAGQPVAKARIEARCMPAAQQQWFANATSDADGRFEMTNCPDALLHLDVHTAASAQFTVCMRDDVDPRAGEVVLEVDPTRVPSAFVAGRVLDADGKPIAAAEVTVLTNDYEWGGGHSMRSGPDGRFRSPAVPPGGWYLTVHAAGLAQLDIPPRTLVAGSTEDFGDLVLTRGNALVVTLQPDAGIALDECVVGLADAVVGLGSERPEHGVVRFPRLAPGDYTITAYAPGAAMRPQTVHVGTAPETAISLRLVAGSAVTVDVRDARGEPVQDRLETELYDSQGMRVDNTPLSPGTGPLLWVRRLVADRYELRLRDHRHRSTAVPITVPADGKPVQQTVRFP